MPLLYALQQEIFAAGPRLSGKFHVCVGYFDVFLTPLSN
jgi:hypothetical protein